MTENKLSTKRRKNDIIADVLRNSNNDEVEQVIARQQEMEDEDEETEASEVSDEDIALAEIGSDTSEEEIAIGECWGNDEDQGGLPMVVKTQYGRDAGTMM